MERLACGAIAALCLVGNLSAQSVVSVEAVAQSASYEIQLARYREGVIQAQYRMVRQERDSLLKLVHWHPSLPAAPVLVGVIATQAAVAGFLSKCLPTIARARTNTVAKARGATCLQALPADTVTLVCGLPVAIHDGILEVRFQRCGMMFYAWGAGEAYTRITDPSWLLGGRPWW